MKLKLNKHRELVHESAIHHAYYIERETIKEIAKHLGCEPSAVIKVLQTTKVITEKGKNVYEQHEQHESELNND